MPRPLSVDDLDLSYLALFLGLRVADEVTRMLAERGMPPVRFSHGFVVQHLIESAPTVSDIAEAQGVTPQAISKTVRELEAAGMVERGLDPTDQRRRPLQLTPLGRTVVEASRDARREVMDDLTARLGAERVSEVEAALRDALDHLGGTEAVRRRNLRMPS